MTRQQGWANWFRFFSFKHSFPFCDSGVPLAWTFQFGNTLLMNRSLHYSAPYSPAKCSSLHGEWILQQRRYMSPRQEQLPLSVRFPWEQAAERWVWWANLMLHYANWSSQLTIALVTGWADWVRRVSVSKKIFKKNPIHRTEVPAAENKQGE